MTLIPNAIWAKYKNLMFKAHESFNQDTIVWVKHTPRVQLFQEQEEPSGNRINLLGLVGFNFFRTWPITKHSNSGELDNQNMLVMFNREYLTNLGYVTPNGYFDFDPDKDYFIHRGIKYKAEGDTFLSQAKDEPLHIQIILRREETITGEEPFNQPTTQKVIEELTLDTLDLDDYAIH